MNQNQVTEIEQIRDHALRVIYGNWAFLKNHSADKEQYANRKLDWVAYVAGKRESRRLLGDVVLQQQDIEFRREFEDACVTTTWTIDLHYPEPKNAEQFPGREFRSIAEQKEIVPYPIPYRCLYSRNIENLFMAGRNISVTHVALGTIRVMRTGGMMGEVVGMAASLCRKHDTTPRGVYAHHLRELQALMLAGVGQPPREAALQPPPWRDAAGPNLALAASVAVSSTLDPAQYPRRTSMTGSSTSTTAAAAGAAPAKAFPTPSISAGTPRKPSARCGSCRGGAPDRSTFRDVWKRSRCRCWKMASGATSREPR